MIWELFFKLNKTIKLARCVSFHPMNSQNINAGREAIHLLISTLGKTDRDTDERNRQRRLETPLAGIPMQQAAAWHTTIPTRKDRLPISPTLNRLEFELVWDWSKRVEVKGDNIKCPSTSNGRIEKLIAENDQFLLIYNFPVWERRKRGTCPSFRGEGEAN